MFSLLIKVANEHISRDKSMSLPLHPSFLANSKLKFDCWEYVSVFRVCYSNLSPTGGDDSYIPKKCHIR